MEIINTICQLVVIVCILITLPFSIVWFLYSLITIKDKKKPIKLFGISVMCIIVFSIIGSFVSFDSEKLLDNNNATTKVAESQTNEIITNENTSEEITTKEKEEETTTKTDIFILDDVKYEFKNITFGLPQGFGDEENNIQEGCEQKSFTRQSDKQTDYLSFTLFEYNSLFTLEEYCNDYIKSMYDNWNVMKNSTEIKNNHSYFVYELFIKQTPEPGTISEKYDLNHAFFAGFIAGNKFYAIDYLFKDSNLKYDDFIKLFDGISINENIETEKITIEQYTTLSDICHLDIPKANQEFRSNVWNNTSVIKITNISYLFEDSFDGKTCNLTVVFDGKKTYDSEGDNHNSDCWFNYKLYDEDNAVIDSGTVITDEICVGEKIKGEEICFYDLEPGKYQLKLFEYE